MSVIGLMDPAHRDLSDPPTASSLHLLAELIADVLVERGLLERPPARTRVLNPAEVADLLGRDRSWVYEHADELGAFRYGTGPRARLGFDLFRIEEWKREQRSRSPGRKKPQRPRGPNLLPFEPLDE